MRDLRSALRGAAALLCLGLAAGPAAAAGGPPSLDIEATCKSAARAEVSVSDNASVEGCLRSERDARKEAERRWGDYSSAAKRQCEQQFQAGGYPSYVEMVTCLELASGTVPTQSGGGGAATAGPGSPQKTTGSRETGAGDVTREPSPKDRTNPIDVLNKQ
ncbi:hypothetical protein [Methylobacterium oxalidis]|uniref:Lysozyme inhibitor LprI N-terminal domain-containing protein n=1 Tax=Methylobacterium oxalidis TaxID=944322 RepID=A0A512IYN8_9HYPH|nr:hypothetical protein [Methylobacterium oxalidis]GEP02831.1 hypothetical protein MOX02_08690 [Methylobacterium oxalidis]GJE32634.1 hypothetical protein LDDCCGHA_2822 [Methylobacterium oxalidis]GLS66768.1 hypothetical protein GCM10007888_51510 [Methylobacterium oxalidis]